jgi:chitodextrinase
MRYAAFLIGLSCWTSVSANCSFVGVDVGNPALAGQTAVIAPGSAYDLTAAGRDIYARSDQFHYAFMVQTGDFDLRVRVASLGAVNEWSKAGLMARESMAAGSREVSVFATPAGGYEFQYRATTGGIVQKVDSVARVSYPNTWVRLKRIGNQFASYTSDDGLAWTPLGTTTLAVPATSFLGMALTSHDVTKTVLAQFRDLSAASGAPDATSPSAPGALAAAAVSATQVNLAWQASTDNLGVAGYKVTRGGVLIATTSALSYADTGLTPATAYTYTVAAFDAAGNTSAPSAAATAATFALADTTAPSSPGGVSAAALSSSQIRIAWQASTDNVGVANYRVTRGGVHVGGTSALSFTDSGLSPSTAYSYSVTAVDAAGNISAPSAAASATTLAQAGGNAASPLGTNLTAVRDWSQEWTFVDAFRASRPWISGGGLNGSFDDGRAVATDADGWVSSLAAGQVARTLLFWDLNGRYPAGTYVVRYDGEGTLAYQGAASKVSGTPGRDVLQVAPANGGIILNITATNPANPLRNIRVLMPGGICEGEPFSHAADAAACPLGAYRSFEEHYASIVFHPKFLERLRAYRVLRFMDWGETNDSTQSAWAGRAKPGDARWSTGKGVPVEVMVDLANRLGADAWFTLPHLADDGYVTAHASLVRQALRADLKAYLEYSNEVWNSQFAQAGYAESRGLALGLSANAFEAQMRFYSRRSVEVFDLWSAAFGDAVRLVRVMASQAANAWVSGEILDYQGARLKTDALAIAPYFGGSLGTSLSTASLTLDQLFGTLQSASLPEALGWIRDQAAVASARSLPLIAYEGGQHLAGVAGLENNAALNSLFDAANRDPRMGALYRSYLDAWKAAGAQIFVHYTHCEGYSKWGRWGSLEYLEQPRAGAPKLDALQGFIEQNPSWW